MPDRESAGRLPGDDDGDGMPVTGRGAQQRLDAVGQRRDVPAAPMSAARTPIRMLVRRQVLTSKLNPLVRVGNIRVMHGFYVV